ncbi:MAG: JAB domain-containing protein [Geminicoccaceae bacterium]
MVSIRRPLAGKGSRRLKLQSEVSVPGEDGSGDRAKALLIRLLSCVTTEASRDAERLLDRFGTVAAVIRAEASDLAHLTCLSWRVRELLTATNVLADALAREALSAPLRDPATLYVAAYRHLRLRPVEHCVAYFLDRDLGVFAFAPISKGTVDHCPLAPSALARLAVSYDAHAVLLAHNHPSGVPAPSRADIEMTSLIEAALRSFDIALHDHLIIGAHGYTSVKFGKEVRLD